MGASYPPPTVMDDGKQVLVAEHDLCGLLLDLVTAVLALGGEV